MADNMMPLFEGAGKFYVYIYRDPRPKKKLVPIYVGKGMAFYKRADIHLRGAKNEILNRILKKIKAADLQPIVEVVAWYDVEADAFECEKALIAKFGRINLKTGSLANLTDGGEGASGMKLSEETKEKLRVSATGRKASDETKAKMSASRKLVTISDDTRAKLSVSLTEAYKSEKLRAAVGDLHRGKVMSDATKALLRAARLLQGNPPITPEQRKKASDKLIGGKRTEESKAKMRLAWDARRERGTSDETRARNSAAAKGRKMSEKTKAILIALNTGRPVSQETRDKISATKKRKAEELRLAKLAAELQPVD